MIRHNVEFDMIIRGIVATRGEEGATISEMRDDYFEIVCEKWPLQGVHHRAIIGYLTELEGLVMVREPNGPCIWYVDDLGNVSERLNQRQCDANNNEIITVSDVSISESVTEISSNNSSNYMLPPAPRVQSAFSSLNGSHPLPSASTIMDAALANVQEVENLQKRHISFGSSDESFHNDTNCQHNTCNSFDHLNLIEEHLKIHNLHVRPNGIGKKTTSTEVECSTNGMNGIHKLNRNEFNGKCHISESGQTSETDLDTSAKSTASISHWDICVMGDDLMRFLISYQLFREDLTHKPDQRFSYCLRGQKIRDAYSTIFDKQNVFKKRFKYILLNLGAIDILLGRNIIDIQADFARLIKAIQIIGLKPIITTLPPIRLADNHPNSKEIYQTLLIFNNFLSTMYGQNHLVVDLCHIFIEAKRVDPDKYYHNVPHSITVNGKPLKILPWNDCGREKILETIDETINIEIPKTCSSTKCQS